MSRNTRNLFIDDNGNFYDISYDVMPLPVSKPPNRMPLVSVTIPPRTKPEVQATERPEHNVPTCVTTTWTVDDEWF